MSKEKTKQETLPETAGNEPDTTLETQDVTPDETSENSEIAGNDSATTCDKCGAPLEQNWWEKPNPNLNR